MLTSFKTVLIDAYGPNIETTKSDNITYSCSNQTLFRSKGQKKQILETIPSKIIKIYIMVIITIRSISCSCEFSNVVDNNVYVIFAMLKWKFQKQAPVALSKWIIKLFSYEIGPSGNLIMIRIQLPKLIFTMKAWSIKWCT